MSFKLVYVENINYERYFLQHIEFVHEWEVGGDRSEKSIRRLDMVVSMVSWYVCPRHVSRDKPSETFE